MSMTYANANTETRAEETFVPRYARPAKSRKSVKTWMILAPIGAVVLLGAGVAMMMGGGEQAALAPAAEATAPAMQTAPAAMSAAQGPVAAVAPGEPAASPTAAPAPVARRAEPRVEPVARRAAPVVERPVAARVETPAASTGPRPYSAPGDAAASTSQLNSTPAATQPPARVVIAPVQPTAPSITGQPLN
ncbi:MAG: hypothetical protein P0Y50_05655 [Candidatus Brevundimonas colombiensis]|uniref:Uncharacterized protein n=1 Tax=Candidatus Brevundimonas colombiensis TaxID=3121376 RepID=A0AAJ6BKP8_9CAUL|nr:hypothetical protein [Brevundimonas sp.]WEK41090.1 MAG: hypothetical protein P0Y50_05655 [Brevundimonas sp.]